LPPRRTRGKGESKVKAKGKSVDALSREELPSTFLPSALTFAFLLLPSLTFAFCLFTFAFSLVYFSIVFPK
jgi:hypothetical protein